METASRRRVRALPGARLAMRALAALLAGALGMGTAPAAPQAGRMLLASEGGAQAARERLACAGAEHLVLSPEALVGVEGHGPVLDLLGQMPHHQVGPLGHDVGGDRPVHVGPGQREGHGLETFGVGQVEGQGAAVAVAAIVRLQAVLQRPHAGGRWGAQLGPDHVVDPGVLPVVLGLLAGEGLHRPRRPRRVPQHHPPPRRRSPRWAVRAWPAWCAAPVPSRSR